MTQTYIYAYTVWKHDCGPYSRRIGEFTAVDNVSAKTEALARGEAYARIRAAYPEDKGWYIGLNSLRPLRREGIALPDALGDMCPASVSWALEDVRRA